MDIANWLRSLGLEQYEDAFRENRVGADILPRLTAEDLRDIGITLVGDRRRLLDAIAALRDSAPPVVDRGAPFEAGTSSAAAAVAGGAERRQLTVMFCDLVGSTALAARLGAEELRGDRRPSSLRRRERSWTRLPAGRPVLLFGCGRSRNEYHAPGRNRSDAHPPF